MLRKMKKMVWKMNVFLFVMLSIILLTIAFAYAEENGGRKVYEGVYYDTALVRIGDKYFVRNPLNTYLENKAYYDSEKMGLSDALVYLNYVVVLRETESFAYHNYPNTELISINGKPWQTDERVVKEMEDVYRGWELVGVKNSKDIMPVMPSTGKARMYVYVGRKATTFYSTDKADGITLDVAPTLEGGRVFIPLRGILDNLGAQLDWDSVNQEVTVQAKGHIVKLKKGKSTAIVDGKTVKISESVKIINGRTLVPVRFISENLGYSVDWLSEVTGTTKFSKSVFRFNRVCITN